MAVRYQLTHPTTPSLSISEREGEFTPPETTPPLPATGRGGWGERVDSLADGMPSAFIRTDMEGLKARFEAFQRSGAGLFLKKCMDDQLPNLASLLAWGTLSTILPLLLGVLVIAGLVLR